MKIDVYWLIQICRDGRPNEHDDAKAADTIETLLAEVRAVRNWDNRPDTQGYEAVRAMLRDAVVTARANTDARLDIGEGR